jgi:hypothetical protein
MPSVSATIALPKRPNIQCDVAIWRNDDGSQEWRRATPASMNLVSSSGGWEHNTSYHNTLFLLDDDVVVAEANDLPADFFARVSCGVSLVASGEALIKGSGYLPVEFTFWFGCV